MTMMRSPSNQGPPPPLFFFKKKEPYSSSLQSTKPRYLCLYYVPHHSRCRYLSSLVALVHTLCLSVFHPRLCHVPRQCLVGIPFTSLDNVTPRPILFFTSITYIHTNLTCFAPTYIHTYVSYIIPSHPCSLHHHTFHTLL